MKHHKDERTLVMIKPDGVQRSLVGEIIRRYERIGLKLVGLKFFVPTEEQVARHYLLDSGWLKSVGDKAIANYAQKGIESPVKDPIKVGEAVLDRLRKYLSSGPMVFMVWQGAHAVAIVRKVTGSTEPLSSDVGTIRGDFVLDSYIMSDGDGRAIRNLIHASGSVEEANREIAHWFDDHDLVSYKLAQEHILYDVNLDGILE